MALRQKLQNRQGGFIVSAELALITTILVIGMIVGLVAVRDAMVAELHDISEAVGELDQSYTYRGLIDNDNRAATEGSTFVDMDDNSFAGSNPSGGGANLGGDDLGLNFVAANDDEGIVIIP